MAVLRPLKLVITNWPTMPTATRSSNTTRSQQPREPRRRLALVPFSKVLYIERDDFMEVAPPKYFRLTPGREVRLRSPIS